MPHKLRNFISIYHIFFKKNELSSSSTLGILEFNWIELKHTNQTIPLVSYFPAMADSQKLEDQYRLNQFPLTDIVHLQGLVCIRMKYVSSPESYNI